MVDLLVIQTTPFCNINCSYCYLPERSNPQKITLATVDRIIDRLLEDKLLPDAFTVVFHSGEPMVPGVKFYEPILELFRSRLSPLGISVRFSIQTNGTLIDDEWCQLIKKFEINIGVSIDGPQFINDNNRLSRNGKSTFDQVIKGIECLQKHDIKYHGIAVISEASLDHAYEIFDFFYNNGFYSLGLNIEEEEGINQKSSLYNYDSSYRIRSFYTQVFELFLQSDQHMAIREFNRAMNMMLRKSNSIPDIRMLDISSHQLSAMSIISVDYQGNFSTYSPELIGQKAPKYNDFIFGNVSQSGFKEPVYNSLLQELDNEIKAGIQSCKESCDYFSICGGGAPANKYYENGSFSSTETKYCKFQIQIPADITLQYLENQVLNVSGKSNPAQ